MVFSQAKCQLSGTKKISSGKKFKWKFLILNLLCRVQSVAIHFSDFCWAHFFGHIVVFCQCGLETQNVLENFVTLEGWVILPVKSHWTMNISANLCRTANYFGQLQINFMKFSLNSPSLIAEEQYAHCSGGKINFWSHLGEERLENPESFHGNPSCSCIESIKAQAKYLRKLD